MIIRIAAYVLIMLVWSYFRIQSLLSKQKNKEAAVYSSLMGISSIVGSLLIAGVDVPSILIPFKVIFEPIGKILLMQ
ncbi:hypothetical protein A8709_18535 [Paenibacillus pectinilyticus]|uniref:EamA domain-containing protein n=1 Tax=Paenibacillus pectinilyticus TaxID=512399 RepID=A0A1C0ZZX8_9BACL|nr:hypothetical protein [Paenibacillus pectinilyticus]OCT13591.1 hypothetical protein A8709_18535 [Paenibacillus pectinilyticus]